MGMEWIKEYISAFWQWGLWKNKGLKSRAYVTKFPVVLCQFTTLSRTFGRTHVDTAIKSAVQSIPETGKLHLRDEFTNLWYMRNQDNVVTALNRRE